MTLKDYVINNSELNCDILYIVGTTVLIVRPGDYNKFLLMPIYTVTSSANTHT